MYKSDSAGEDCGGWPDGSPPSQLLNGPMYACKAVHDACHFVTTISFSQFPDTNEICKQTYKQSHKRINKQMEEINNKQTNE